MNNYSKANKYDIDFVAENLMVPNSLMVLEELIKDLNLQKGMRALELGSGIGLTSIFLVKEFDVEVFWVNLWISPAENYERFKKMCVDNKIIPFCFNDKTKGTVFVANKYKNTKK